MAASIQASVPFTQGAKNGDVINKETHTFRMTLFDAALYFIFSF